MFYRSHGDVWFLWLLSNRFILQSDKDNSGWFCVSSTTIELSYGEFLNGPVLSHASTTEIFRDTDDSWLRHAICITMRHARHVGEQKRSGRLFLIGYSLGIVGFMAFC